MIELLNIGKDTIESIVSSRSYEDVDAFLYQKISPKNSELRELFESHGISGFSSSLVGGIMLFHNDMNELINSKTFKHVQSVAVKKTYIGILDLYLDAL